jgi:Tfp pilus assembly protein PilV
MKKIIISILLIIVVVAGIVGYVLYNKKHRSVASEQAIAINATELFRAYEKNEEESNKKYLDKVIEVKGTILSIDKNEENKDVVTLDSGDVLFGIKATIEDTMTNYRVGDLISVKGICTGYLSDVVLVHCVIKKSETK